MDEIPQPPKDLLKNVEMIKQPLLDSEGRLNPACMNEILATIGDVKPTYKRLAGDGEWNKKVMTFRREIVAAFAQSACRLSPYGVPDGLENVCKYLNECLKTEFEWKSSYYMQYCELSLCDINKALHDILYEKGVAEFDAWNRCKKGETPEVQFTSAQSGPIHPDYDFISLDVLMHHTCIIIRNDRREFNRFNAEFEKRHIKL